MRILVAMPPFEVFSPTTGGAVSTVAEGLGRAWSAQGHHVQVATPAAAELHRTVDPFIIDFPRCEEGAWPRRLEAKIEGRLRQFDWPGYRLYVSEVQRAVRAVNPQCLILHNDLVMPAMTLPLAPAKIVVHLHNQVAVNRPERAQRVLHSVCGTVAVSDFIAADARKRFGADNVRTIHNGVDVAGFQRPRADRMAGAPLRVVFLGRLLRDKGPHVLLEAARQLAESGSPIAVTVIGSPTFNRSEDHAKDSYVREVTHTVEALGGTYIPHLDRSAVVAQLAAQDVLVVPSLFPEPFALVVLEAMAAGCAVVASDIGGLPEAVSGAGLLFPPGDATALASHLRKLDDDAVLLGESVRRGRERAAQRDWSHVATEWAPLFDRLR